MAIVVQTPPATEPLTAAEVATHCRLPDLTLAQTVHLDILISAARQAAETELRRYLITQTLDAYFDKFPGADYWPIDSSNIKPASNQIILPPLQSVVSITYLDAAGTTQTLSPDRYIVDSVSEPARIFPATGFTWPATKDQVNAVKVQFVAGYGNAEAVPNNIKLWMLLRIGHAYENREPVIIGASTSELSRSYFDGLLDSERVESRIYG